MARKGSIKPRKLEQDPVYKNKLVTQLINRVMKDGKKTIAQKQVYNAFDAMKAKGDDPMKIYGDALNNVRPAMEVKSRRIGGAAYQVPTPVRGERKDTLAIRWLLGAARARNNSEFKTFALKLEAELYEAAKGEGGAVKKRDDMQKMAEANRAFSHFKW